MSTLADRYASGELDTYDTITVAQESFTASDLIPVSVTDILEVFDTFTVAQHVGLSNLIPAALDPRITPVIIFS